MLSCKQSTFFRETALCSLQASIRQKSTCFRCHLKPRLRNEARQVVVGIAQGQFNHRQPLEVMGCRQFVGDTHAPMPLYRLLADKFQRLPDPRLARCNSNPCCLPIYIKSTTIHN